MKIPENLVVLPFLTFIRESITQLDSTSMTLILLLHWTKPAAHLVDFWLLRISGEMSSRFLVPNSTSIHCFPCHIYGPYVEIGPSKPSATPLPPSKIRDKNFLSLQYPRAIRFEANIGVSGKLLRGCNVPWKIVTLPPIKERHIGLSQHGCSVILETSKGGSWLGAFSTVGEACIHWRDNMNNLSWCGWLRELRCCRKEDYTQIAAISGWIRRLFGPPSFSSQVADDGPQGRSLLEDMVYYWEKYTPSPFNF
jgi:hypothetical protein